MSEAEPLSLKFLGALIEELGRRMYPSATATIAELISNAWDADAESVWVQIPLDQQWTQDSVIAVTDDGNGMERAEAATRYLHVGRKRRESGHEKSDVRARKVHGRKGVGKLAAFGTADTLHLITKSRNGEATGFVLDYEDIRRAPPGSNVPVREDGAVGPPRRPDGTELEHGTQIELRGIRLTQPVSEERFLNSMSRRFALSSSEMRVYINDKELGRFAISTRFRFPPDALPENVTAEDELAVETVGTNIVRWWIGFTSDPIKEDDLRGVSVIARGKMAQRPFMFQRGRGVTSQLGQEYLVGEVFADWIDDDPAVDGDLIATNRAEIMIEDGRLAEFLAWGRSRLDWALRKRQQLVEEQNVRRLELSETVQKRLLEGFTPTERRIFTGIAAKLAGLPEARPEQVETLMLDLIDGQSDKAVRGMIETISQTEPEYQDAIWALVAEFGLIDARRLKSIIEARLQVIRKLRELVEQGAREVPEIHQHIRDNYWLIDPRWQLMDDEVELTRILEEQFGANSSEAEGKRLDFVYCLGPRPPAVRDVVFLVEIKRGTLPDGHAKRVGVDEIHRFHDYYVTLDARLKRSDTTPPRLRAIMIGTDYTNQALLSKSSYEDLGLEFKSWAAVLDETERLHVGWLELSGQRSEGPRGDTPGGKVQSVQQ